jgi:hypothetical protein
VNRLTESQLNNLKARIDEANERSDSCCQGQFLQLITNNLVSADQSLLQARMHHSQGNHSQCAFHYQLAALQLGLALRHMTSTGRDTKHQFSGKAQEYINLLGTGIIEFKTVIEWKNCKLREEVRQWFVECVDLHEDALNQLRFGKPKAAECTALGGLLLQEHICRAAQDEHFGQVSIVGKCARTKLPAEAAAIFNLTERLSKTRRTIMLKSGFLGHKFTEQFLKAHSESETTLIDAISAFAGDNKQSLKRLVLEAQFKMGALDRLVAESKQLSEQGDADEMEAQTGKDTAMGEAGGSIVSPELFAHQASLLQQILKERVDDRQLLSLRTLSLASDYRSLHRAYVVGEYGRADKFVGRTRVGLEKLRLLFLQAQLFTGDK